jgi:thioredoxin-like negative regulator of GroEL
MNTKELKLVSAAWCGPCTMLKNKLKASELQVDTIQADDEPEFCVKYGVKSIPTLVVIDGDSFELVKGSEDIINTIKENIKN